MMWNVLWNAVRRSERQTPQTKPHFFSSKVVLLSENGFYLQDDVRLRQ